MKTIVFLQRSYMMSVLVTDQINGSDEETVLKYVSWL